MRVRAYRKEPNVQEIPRDTRAYHEAGHTVVAALLGMRVGRITIRPEGENSGHMEVEPSDFLAAPIEGRVMVYLAGMWGAWMNPSLRDAEAGLDGVAGDYQAARALVGLEGPEWDAYLQARVAELGGLVGHDHAERALHALAGMLLERTELVVTSDTEAAKILIHLHP